MDCMNFACNAIILGFKYNFIKKYIVNHVYMEILLSIAKPVAYKNKEYMKVQPKAVSV